MLGEHSVVYGRPAIAVPIPSLQAQAAIEPAPAGRAGELWVDAPQVGYSGWTAIERTGQAAGRAPESGSGDTSPGAPANASPEPVAVSDPQAGPVAGLVLAAQVAFEHFGAAPHEPLRLQVASEIPVAAGMGSSAALSVAILRAVAEYLGQPLAPETASKLAYQVEVHYHGTPSGIDNAVVAHGVPIYFQQQREPEPLRVAAPLTLVLADSGRRSATRAMVLGVRRRREAEASSYERIFDEIAAVVARGRAAIESGQPAELGRYMNENQALLERIGVSTAELEALNRSALESGALGAKLSGAGGGGLVLALAEASSAAQVQAALRRAGAISATVSVVG